jgi:hypothetical protein
MPTVTRAVTEPARPLVDESEIMEVQSALLMRQYELSPFSSAARSFGYWVS